MERASGTRGLRVREKKRDLRTFDRMARNMPTLLFQRRFPLCSAVCFLVVLDVKLDFRRNGGK